MLDFFGTIIGYLEMVWSYFLNIINSMISFLSLILAATALPLSISYYVPSFIASSVVAVSSIAVLKLIIGRDN